MAILIFCFIAGFFNSLGAWYFLCFLVFEKLSHRYYDPEDLGSFWQICFCKLFGKKTEYLLEHNELFFIIFVIAGIFVFGSGIVCLPLVLLASHLEVTTFYPGEHLLDFGYVVTERAIAPINVISYAFGCFMFFLPELGRQIYGFCRQKVCLNSAK